MKEILSLLPKPSRYLGIEEGSVHKRPESVALHCSLAFPDLYEVGMSYLGQKILYGVLNDRPDILAERVFAPCVEAGELLRRHGLPLATLESDTPVARTDLLGFSVTHELCFTNVLYMLDLAGIPLRADRRGDDFTWPLVAAGGGCAAAAEPLAPFMDVMLLGDGERLLPEFCDLLLAAKAGGWSRSRLLAAAAHIPGVYVPSLFVASGQVGALRPVDPALPRPARRIAADLDLAPYPVRQVVPFGAVHNRLSLEIARGCTRGCRFCQAGMLYRPARERSLPLLRELLDRCLDATGFDDVSFLALSTGDFSGLRRLFLDTTERCAQEQVSVSLPSLRVGSIDSAIMARMADIRRTGATLAPEAGSQRLRDRINKGITEEALLTHVRRLREHGWQQVKLYFMIGLPGETEEDIDAIADLCRKARDAGGRDMQITGAISPFVPKAHTPFQWEPQLDQTAIEARIARLRGLFRTEKRLKLRWHNPEASVLEGILSRGDRRLADVVEGAYRKGALFCDWMEHFALTPWLEAMAEAGLDPAWYTGPRELDAPLPWDHLESGISKEFLLRERRRALEGKLTEDCRYAACRQCGACDTTAGPSRLPHADPSGEHKNRLNFAQRDQEEKPLAPLPQTPGSAGPAPDSAARRKAPPAIAAELTIKAVRYRIWHTKMGAAAFLSQLELQSLLERAMRRAGLPPAFSQGFHPLPLLSFARALPVGVESAAEWFSIVLRRPLSPEETVRRLNGRLPEGLDVYKAEPIPFNDKSTGAVREDFMLRHVGTEANGESFNAAWRSFAASEESLLLTRETKKGPRTADIRPFFRKVAVQPEGVALQLDWSGGYISPLTLVRAITPEVGLHELKLLKLGQMFSTEPSCFNPQSVPSAAD